MAFAAPDLKNLQIDTPESAGLLALVSKSAPWLHGLLLKKLAINMICAMSLTLPGTCYRLRLYQHVLGGSCCRLEVEIPLGRYARRLLHKLLKVFAIPSLLWTQRHQRQQLTQKATRHNYFTRNDSSRSIIRC